MESLDRQLAMIGGTDKEGEALAAQLAQAGVHVLIGSREALKAQNAAHDLNQQIGIDAFDAGVLANAVAVEALTAVLIAVNIKYKIKGAGIRLSGVPCPQRQV